MRRLFSILLAVALAATLAAGVAPSDITVYDAGRVILDYMQALYSAGPLAGVQFQYRDLMGAHDAQPDRDVPVVWSQSVSGDTNYLPTCVTEADYLINLANLKGHVYGITLGAKNHYGTIMNPSRMRAPGESVPITEENARWQQSPLGGDYTSSVFISQDPVALDSVGADFPINEPTVTRRNSALRENPNVENYLHEASLVAEAPSGTTYYNGNGRRETNLGGDEGIELVRIGADTGGSQIPDTQSHFADVPANAWFASAVAYCRDHGLMSGTTATTFAPDAATSRAMLVTILYRQAGSPNIQASGEFHDVAASVWYADAIGWAAQNGIVSGYSDGRFGPNDPVTREQLATILWRSTGSPAAKEEQTFADQGSIAAYAAPAVAWARERGIVSGKTGNRFAPNGLATRGETAVMLQRFGTLDKPTVPPSDEPIATPPPSTPPSALQIQIQDGTRTIVFELNDSPAAKSLYDQLPLTIAVQDYSDNEKIFYPPQKLDTTDAVGAEGPAGTLAYFAPWGDVVMYYSSCGPYGGLYELGHAVSGGEQIENVSGTLQITQILD